MSPMSRLRGPSWSATLVILPYLLVLVVVTGLSAVSGLTGPEDGGLIDLGPVMVSEPLLYLLDLIGLDPIGLVPDGLPRWAGPLVYDGGGLLLGLVQISPIWALARWRIAAARAMPRAAG